MARFHYLNAYRRILSRQFNIFCTNGMWITVQFFRAVYWNGNHLKGGKTVSFFVWIKFTSLKSAHETSKQVIRYQKVSIYLYIYLSIPTEDPSVILREHFRTIIFFLTNFAHAISRKWLGRF